MQKLIADVLIGNFIMGNQLKIRNAANTVTLDESGILIKVPKPEGDDETVFQADNAGNVMLKGTICATDGEIGGLKISDSGIGVASKDAGISTFSLGFGAEGITTSGGLFGVTADGVLTAKSGTIGGLTLSENSISASNLFSVNSAGKLTAKDADISGVITAKSGTIGGFTIGETALYNGINSMTASDTGVYLGTDGLNLGGNFTVDGNGNTLIKKGSITLQKELDTGGTQHNFFNESSIKVEHDSNNWHSSVSIEAETVFMECTDGSRTSSLTLRIQPTSAYIESDSTINIGKYNPRDTVGLTIYGGSNSIKLDGSNLTLYATNEGRIDGGTWYRNGGAIDFSDEKIKNSIEEIDDRYSLLFDNLKPVRYKYNAGTSDRYHTGLIAQDVKNAIEQAGLSTKEFAAYAEWEADSRDKASCGIRYEELIPLCIAEIQKLKKLLQVISQ